MNIRIRWSPQQFDLVSVYSQPEPGVLHIDGYRHDGTFWVPYSAEYDFRGTEDGEWDTSGMPDVRRAYRSGGVPHLELVRRYRAGESLWWDTGEYIDYGEQVDLMSRPGVEDGTD